MSGLRSCQKRLDRLCDAFEVAYRANERPLLAEYLERLPPAERKDGIAELLKLDLELRREAGDQPTAEEYAEHLPELRDVILHVFESCQPNPTYSRDCAAVGLHVRCPHCHNPLELVPDAELDSIKCPSCGSDFSLVSDLERTRPWSPSSQIAHFKLLDRIGGGAFGVVWKAHDTKLDRTVAIKLPRKGQFDAQQEKAFVREAQNAARLDHPGIVPVFEVGRENDVLYIASAFVQGITLADRLTSDGMNLVEAADMTIALGEALHYAHEHGVVHRDIKPSNVLLGNDNNPRLTDFGLAKRESTEVTMSVTGQVLGTPAYMSPEQAKGDSCDADRRSDVYSLGVMLFQMLTGELPFRGNVQMQIHQRLNEDAPNPRKLNPTVPRDLATIALKCLERFPAQRYATALELTQELQRWRRGDLIRSRPTSFLTRVYKYTKRKPAAALLFTTLFILAIGGPLAAYRQSTLKREAIAANAEEAAQRAIAQRRLNYVQSNIDLLMGVFEDLDVYSGRQSDVPLEAELAKRFAEAGHELSVFSEDPLVTARLQNAYGKLLVNLGHHKEAIPLHKAALAATELASGDDPTESLTSMISLALAHLWVGRTDDAIAMYEKALAICRSVEGEEHPHTVPAMVQLGFTYSQVGRTDDAIRMLEQALELTKQRLGDRDPETLAIIDQLAAAYTNAGRADEAIGLHEQVLKARKIELGETHPRTLTSMSNLAMAYQEVGRLEEAIALNERTLSARRSELGNTHPNTIVSMNNLANVYTSANRPDEAIPLLELVLSENQSKFGDRHPRTLSATSNLAAANKSAGRLDAAIMLYEPTLEVQISELGTDHPSTLVTQNSLAMAYFLAGRLDEAVAMSEESLRASKSALGEDHPDTLINMTNLAMILLSCERVDEASSLSEDAMRMLKARFGLKNPQTLAAMTQMAAAYHKADRFEEAVSLSEQLLQVSQPYLGKNHPISLRGMNLLGRCYTSLGRIEEATSLLQETLELMKQEIGKDNLDTLTCMADLAIAYQKAGFAEQGDSLLHQTLEQMQEKLGAEHSETLRVREALKSLRQNGVAVPRHTAG